MPYSPVENERRHKLIKWVSIERSMTVRQASQKLNIKFTTAKSILKIWRN